MTSGGKGTKVRIKSPGWVVNLALPTQDSARNGRLAGRTGA